MPHRKVQCSWSDEVKTDSAQNSVRTILSLRCFAEAVYICFVWQEIIAFKAVCRLCKNEACRAHGAERAPVLARQTRSTRLEAFHGSPSAKRPVLVSRLPRQSAVKALTVTTDPSGSLLPGQSNVIPKCFLWRAEG